MRIYIIGSDGITATRFLIASDVGALVIINDEYYAILTIYIVKPRMDGLNEASCDGALPRICQSRDCSMPPTSSQMRTGSLDKW